MSGLCRGTLALVLLLCHSPADARAQAFSLWIQPAAYLPAAETATIPTWDQHLGFRSAVAVTLQVEARIWRWLGFSVEGFRSSPDHRFSAQIPGGPHFVDDAPGRATGMSIRPTAFLSLSSRIHATAGAGPAIVWQRFGSPPDPTNRISYSSEGIALSLSLEYRASRAVLLGIRATDFLYHPDLPGSSPSGTVFHTQQDFVLSAGIGLSPVP